MPSGTGYAQYGTGYAQYGTDLAYAATRSRMERMAQSHLVVKSAIGLRPRYALPGTDSAYGARGGRGVPVR
eukprot:2666951-Rhodomonas_salina.2